jgi:hypothetical protein
MVDRCDKCGIELAPPDPDDPDDVGTRCGACVREFGPQLPTASASPSSWGWR